MPLKPRENSVYFLAAWIDACALWRMYMPHLNMPGSGFTCFAQKPDYGAFVGNDILVVQRCFSQPQYEFIHAMAQLGMKVVYDLDDNMWDIPEYNPAAEPLTKAREGFKQCIQMVDVVSVSTKTLAKVVRHNVKQMINQRTGKEIPIVVTENRIDPRVFVTPQRPQQDARVRIGWAGSNSHTGDLAIAVDVLGALAAHNPDKVEVEFRGCLPPEGSQLVSLPNFRYRGWVPVAQYGSRMPVWGWDIALAPATAHPFNESKSCIKMLEAAYCRIPCLASWIQPYADFCRWDKDLKWLLCAGASAWEAKLRDLVNDPALRNYLGNRMHQVMLDYYSLDKPHEGWEAVFAAATKAA